MSLGRHTHGKDARVKRPSPVAGADRPGRISAGQLEKMIDSRTKNTLESERHSIVALLFQALITDVRVYIALLLVWLPQDLAHFPRVD
jgi:hypothetical protein